MKLSIQVHDIWSEETWREAQASSVQEAHEIIMALQAIGVPRPRKYFVRDERTNARYHVAKQGGVLYLCMNSIGPFAHVCGSKNKDLTRA